MYTLNRTKSLYKGVRREQTKKVAPGSGCSDRRYAAGMRSVHGRIAVRAQRTTQATRGMFSALLSSQEHAYRLFVQARDCVPASRVLSEPSREAPD